MNKDRELEQLAEFMRWAIGSGMIVAGADKFTHLLCDWDKYLSPRAEKLIPMEGSKFMKLVGLIEIAAGAGVLIRPTTQWASFIGSAWLLGIAGNLLTHPVNYKDIAVRDVHMAIEVFALAVLARHYIVHKGESANWDEAIGSDGGRAELERAA